jgi:membrane-bound lytic murein transglycosylase B
MTATRQGRLRKAAALVPLALLSAAWTVSISTTGAPQASAGDKPTLPDGSTVPADALQIPASVSTPDGPGLGTTGETSTQIVSSSSASSIPSTALAAYQRAETVINKADASCHLPWQLLAAIGRVESDHGRANGNQLSVDGVAEPGIFGKALDGRAGTSRIADTDGGEYDGDTSVDRAVGPMQFIPSTWSTVGVDADGDGRRDPQDIDDAALAAAVYLCSGTDDLSTSAGQSAAVYRYNHSSSYVATVLAVMQSYLAGDYTAAPNSTIPATYFEPDTTPAWGHGKAKKKAGHKHGAAPTKAATTAPSTPASSPAPQQPAGSGTPSTPKPPKVTATNPVAPVTEPVKEVLATTQELVTVCTNALTAKYGSAPGEAVTKCVNQLVGKTLPEAQAAVGGVVAGLAGLVNTLLGGVVGGLLGK